VWVFLVTRVGTDAANFHTQRDGLRLLRIALKTKQNTTDGNVRCGRPLTFQLASRRKPVHSPTRFSLCGASKALQKKEVCLSHSGIKKKILALLLKPLVIMGYAVAQLVEALRYKPEGRGFDSRWCHWNISLT